MLKNRTVKDLYPYALIEGEGVGTAYEYVVKRKALSGWLPSIPAPKRLGVIGLPQKYGASLDFFLLAEELGASLTVIDDRLGALEKGKQALRNVQTQGFLVGLEPEFYPVSSLSAFELDDQFDLAVSSEVLQRISAADRSGYVASVRDSSKHAAIFCPNKDNESHVGISGLDGLHLKDIQVLFPNAAVTNYIDMPPFPPGITRTDEQREQATTGTFEAVAMWGLDRYAAAEFWFPRWVRKTYGHIVYAFSSSS